MNKPMSREGLSSSNPIVRWRAERMWKKRILAIQTLSTLFLTDNPNIEMNVFMGVMRISLGDLSIEEKQLCANYWREVHDSPEEGDTV